MAFTNYDDFVTSLANTIVVPADNAEFLIELPRIIDDAEQRIYRELDLLSTIVRDTSGTLTTSSRNFTFPQHIVVLESLNVFSTVGVTTTGRTPLTPTTREYIDAVYGDETATDSSALPEYYAMITDQTVIVGPSPGAAYTMEVVGTIRPAPLSATNTTTYLTLYLPDLFFAAAVLFGYAYLKDFGVIADDPQAGATWSKHYQDLFISANTEENRKKYASQAWTPKQPAPLATPQRS